MNDTFRSAYVYIRKTLAGILKETDEGYSFKYFDDYVSNLDNPPVSLTMPLSKKEYFSKSLFPFFDGLIPEGWLLDIVSKNWKLNLEDRFGILLVSCVDPIGIVSIKEINNEVPIL